MSTHINVGKAGLVFAAVIRRDGICAGQCWLQFGWLSPSPILFSGCTSSADLRDKVVDIVRAVILLIVTAGVGFVIGVVFALICECAAQSLRT